LLAVNFTGLSDRQFYEALHQANAELIEDYYAKQKNGALKSAHELYTGLNKNFRGFRPLV
jgi:hypothetical protein